MSHSHGIAEAVRIESDEAGWELHVLTDDGWHVFNIHGEAEELTRQCQQIDNWLADGYWAAKTHVPAPTEEDLEGYALNDPKRVTLQRQIDERRPW